jgi:hypothetical protein
MKRFVITGSLIAFGVGILVGAWKLFFGRADQEPAGVPTTEWEDAKQRADMKRSQERRRELDLHPEDTLAG